MIDIRSSNMATSSTKKPFSYCPGGINFNELKTKSPSMARRIEKHQEHMSSPPSQQAQLRPSAPSPANQQMVNPLISNIQSAARVQVQVQVSKPPICLDSRPQGANHDLYTGRKPLSVFWPKAPDPMRGRRPRITQFHEKIAF